ncbi:nodulation protein NfeD [bacterium]|nr:nodulation protein NfeD [bacterium]
MKNRIIAPHRARRPLLQAPAALTVAASAIILAVTALAAVAAAPIVHLTWEGPITPVAAEYLAQGIETAAADKAAAVLIQLDTPGGLDTSMRDIIKAQMASPIPVVVWVGPAGSRAASAGAFLTVAAHVAAMAPGTNIGSASPVQMMGAAMDSTMAHKVTNDAAAYIASIAEKRGRNAAEARLFVTEALNLTAEDARSQGIIDFLAPTLPALLDSLRGRTVAMESGPVTLAAETAVLEARPPGARQKLLKILADPNVAYFLLMLGIYGMFFELSNPGAFAPGIIGGICLLLALFAFQALPVDYSGAALILLGAVLLILEVKVTSHGALSIGGVASLVLGSLMLFDSPEPWARVSLQVMIPTVAAFAGFFLLCVWLAVRAQRRPPATGLQALVGETGRVIVAIPEVGTGKVIVHGEVWHAESGSPLPRDAVARVVSVEGRIVQVEAADPAATHP